MSDVLMTHSFHLAYDAKQSKKMQPYPPLGTLYAATTLQQAGMAVAVFDSTFTEPLAGFTQALRKHKPKIVAIYEDDFNFVSKMCLAHMRTLGQRLARQASAQGATVIMHGSDATDHPEEYFRHGADYVLSGESEQALASLCSRLLQSQPVGAIPGLLPAGTARSTDGASHPRNPGWVELPTPARDLIDLQPYSDAWTKAHGYSSMNMVSSRGCPFRCNWCAKPISGDKFNIRDPHDVANEIHQLHSQYGVQHIWFGDDVFALNRHWVQAFADAIEMNGTRVPFKIQSRADLMSDATVDALRRAGCEEIWMGVESGSQTILDAMGKGLKVADIYSARQKLARAGIRACYFLQFGYPGEGWEEICETIDLVKRSKPDDIGVSLSYPLPGTAFFQAVQNQLGEKRNWNDSDDLCAMFTAHYKDVFYHALRDAIHAEVAGWSETGTGTSEESLQSIWDRVLALEPISRNANALILPFQSPSHTPQASFMPVEDLLATARRA